MCKKHITGFLFSCLCIGYLSSCSTQESTAVNEDSQVPVIDLFSQEKSGLSKEKCNNKKVDVIHLKGKVRQSGMDLLQKPPQPRPFSGVSNVHVWLADYPLTKSMNIMTDTNGLWEVILIKSSSVTLNLSFAYEKDFYPETVEKMVFPNGIPAPWNATTICSNVYTVKSSDITDIAVQMPDELFLYYAKSRVEAAISAKIGTAYKMSNIVIGTVGKSWATIYDTRLPHGDADATVLLNPTQTTPLQGPIYFDETVTLNPAITKTSIDGGFMFNSLLPGTYTIAAQKAPYTYTPIQFNIREAFNLYISSPPHSIMSSNSSGAGQ